MGCANSRHRDRDHERESGMMQNSRVSESGVMQNSRVVESGHVVESGVMSRVVESGHVAESGVMHSSRVSESVAEPGVKKRKRGAEADESPTKFKKRKLRSKFSAIIAADAPALAVHSSNANNNNNNVEKSAGLTKLQCHALSEIAVRCEMSSAMAKPKLLERVKKFKFTARELGLTLQWIECFAPIIIHISLSSTLSKLDADTEYRSLFETKTGKGNTCLKTRADWESRYFGKLYDLANENERVKYGTLNLCNDPLGLQNACGHYGKSILVLKPHMRSRVTWSNIDSSCHNAHIGTLHSCAHVLMEMDDERLRSILTVGSGRRAKTYPKSVEYWEAQIAGKILFNQDIERIVAHPDDAKDTAKIAHFARKNNIDLTFLS